MVNYSRETVSAITMLATNYTLTKSARTIMKFTGRKNPLE